MVPQGAWALMSINSTLCGLSVDSLLRAGSGGSGLAAGPPSLLRGGVTQRRTENAILEVLGMVTSGVPALESR